MTISPSPALERLPAVVFQFAARRLELLNKEAVVYPGLTPARLAKILRGEWRSLVPEEFHPVVRKLGRLSKSESYTTIEFPVYWMGDTVWLRVFAAAVAQENARRKIIGLAQDVTAQRLSSSESEAHPEQTQEEEDQSWKKLRHGINGCLTSIMMNCELLLESSWDATLRRKIEGILSQAFRIDQFLQRYRD